MAPQSSALVLPTDIALVAERLRKLAPAHAAASALRLASPLDSNGLANKAARTYTIDLSAVAIGEIASLALDLADGLILRGVLSLILLVKPQSRDHIAKRRELLQSLSNAYLFPAFPASPEAEQFVTVVKCDDWRRPAFKIQSDRAFVLELYRELLDREADQGGLDCYTSELADGSSRMQILRTFMLSTERPRGVPHL